MVRAVVGVVVVAALVGAAVSGAFAPDGPAVPSVVPRPADAQPMVVGEVLSGDTVVLVNPRPGSQVQGWGQVTARLLDIDAPDLGTSGPVRSSTADECFAGEARDRLRLLLPEGSIAWVATGRTPRDEDGSWFMRVWAADGVLVSYALAVDGFARALPTPPGATFSTAITRASDQAFLRGAGLWSACSAAAAAD